MKMKFVRIGHLYNLVQMVGLQVGVDTRNIFAKILKAESILTLLKESKINIRKNVSGK